MDTVLTSLAKTHHVVTVEQGWPTAGIGAEVSARISESMLCSTNTRMNYNIMHPIWSLFEWISGNAFFQLDAPI